MSHLSIFKNFWEHFFKHENAALNGEQEKESISRERVGQKNLSLGITICHHSASLVMPKGDPWDGFSFPIHTLVMYSYNPHNSNNSHESISVAAAVACRYNTGLQIIVLTRKFFSYFSTKTYVVGTQKNRLDEKVLLSTQNICLN